MKNSLLTSTLILLFIHCFAITQAQSTFTISELEKLCSYSSSGFETFILERGYSYQSKFSTEDTKIYWYDTKRPNGRQDQVTRTENSIVSNLLTFTTTSKEFYLKFKSTLPTSGYKYVKEEQRELANMMSTWYYYANNKFTIALYSYTTSDGITTYAHQVSKNNF